MILSTRVPDNTTTKRTTVGGIKAEWVSVPESTDKIFVYVHGGGFIMGSPRTHRGLIANLAKSIKAKALVIDYGLAPEHPYPDALDEIEKAWLALIKDRGLNPENIAMIADSAGGNLALASVLRLRDKKLPLPACIALISPTLDMTLSGETFITHESRDPLLNKKMFIFLRDSYLQGAPQDIPYTSPLFANLKGLPPLLLHVGSEEILLAEGREMIEKAQKAGVDAQLFVGEGMWHFWHGFAHLPEAKQAISDIGKFVNKYTSN
jgi:acetyl esterase/lipase